MDIFWSSTQKKPRWFLDPRSFGDKTPLSIKTVKIQQVNSYRYLSIHLDNLFSVHWFTAKAVFSTLRVVGVSDTIMFLFLFIYLSSSAGEHHQVWDGSVDCHSLQAGVSGTCCHEGDGENSKVFSPG